MLTPGELKSGDTFLYKKDPFEVIEVKHLHMGRGGAVFQMKIKNLKTNKTLRQNFKSSDNFDQAFISQKTIEYIYCHRDKYWFQESKDKTKRFNLSYEKIGENTKFLKQGMRLNAFVFEEKIISASLELKINLKVVQAPPDFRGNTAEGGSKIVVLENNTEIKTPFFIKEGDIIKINTKTGKYIERVKE